MDGQPVWLCSVSRRSKAGEIIGTSQWSADDFRRAELFAHASLAGVGDRDRERAFRMNITFCIHRAVSDAEKTKLPAAWDGSAGGMAGGPVEVLWSRGIGHRPAAMPCCNPSHHVIDGKRPDLWVPVDCGACEPCRARAEIEAKT